MANAVYSTILTSLDFDGIPITELNNDLENTIEVDPMSDQSSITLGTETEFTNIARKLAGSGRFFLAPGSIALTAIRALHQVVTTVPGAARTVIALFVDGNGRTNILHGCSISNPGPAGSGGEKAKIVEVSFNFERIDWGV